MEVFVSMEMEITDARRIIRQNLRMILSLVVISVLGAGLISFFVLKPEYEAKATLLVKKTNSGSQIEYDDLITSEKLVKTYGEIIKSSLVLEKVIADLNLNMTVEQLLEKIQVKADNESLVTAISVRDGNPVQTVAITNELAETSRQTWNSIMEMENVMIIDKAKQEDIHNPVRPRPYFNMMLAFFLSLLAGIGYALFREMMDKTVKTEEEIEEMLALPVLGVIPVMQEKRTNQSASR
jgi:capsular polysaccharide biosynthesis protein